VLEALKREAGVEVEVLDLDVPGVAEVDAKLVRICLDRGAALLTLDTTLAKAAALAGVPVLNLHALALALRAPGRGRRRRQVLLLKAGKGARAGGRLPRRRLDGRRRAGARAPRHRAGRPRHQRADHRERPARLRASRRRGRDDVRPPPARPRRRRAAVRGTRAVRPRASRPRRAAAPVSVGVARCRRRRGVALGPARPRRCATLAASRCSSRRPRLRPAPSSARSSSPPRPEVERSPRCSRPYDVEVVAGGAERRTRRAALAALPPDGRLVLVHDAARCLTAVAVVERVVAACARCEAVVPVCRSPTR
jgi:hypothetical protein